MPIDVHGEMMREDDKKNLGKEVESKWESQAQAKTTSWSCQ